MIVFSSKKLESALAENRLTQWDKVKYIILIAVLYSLSYGPIRWIKPTFSPTYGTTPEKHPLFFILCSALAAYIAYRGIKECFRINEDIDAKSFFERWACLSVPVGLRLTFYMMPVFIFFPFLIGLPFERVFVSLLNPIAALIYYHLIARSFIRLGELLKPPGVDVQENPIA
jgi:hypothetical protein